MERGHRSSPSPLFVRQNSLSSERHNTPPIAHLALPPLRSHYPRDGLDFRRPASSAATNNEVIDLTSDDDSAPSQRPTPHLEATAGPSATTRPPRNIIDLSADTSPVQSPNAASARRPSSPEVQFVSSRPRSTTGQRPSHPPPFLNPDPDAAYRRPEHIPDLVLDEDDDVIIAGARTGINLLRPQGFQRAQIGRLAQMVFQAGERGIQAFARSRGRGGAMGFMPTLFGPDDEDFIHPPMGGMPMPGFMNYETVAFDLGHGDEPPQQPVPKYDPPPPAADGFTRDPTEEDTIVCPNCDDELAVGDSEEKRQVWVVKACGHVSDIL